MSAKHSSRRSVAQYLPSTHWRNVAKVSEFQEQLPDRLQLQCTEALRDMVTPCAPALHDPIRAIDTYRVVAFVFIRRCLLWTALPLAKALIQNRTQSIKVLPSVCDVIGRWKLARERPLVVCQILPGFKLEIGCGERIPVFV